MYPTLYHAFLDLFGMEVGFLKLFNSFGFFVVIAFLTGAYILKLEIDRKTQEGVIPVLIKKVKRGEKPSLMSFVSNSLLGALLGFKFLYLVLDSGDALANPPAFLLSFTGSWFGAIIGAALFYWLRAQEVKKEAKEFPKEVEVEYTVTSKEHSSNIAMTAALWGFLGAKLFFIVEDPDHIISFFTEFSVDSILSGLTVFGGLILGGGMVLYYFKKHGIPVFAGADAAALAYILSYGVGRIGCQVSGDGDWGIANKFPKPDWLSWAPDWIWAYDYPNNVNGVQGFSEKGGYIGKIISPDMNYPIFDGYGTYLDPAVYPTPIYELFMASAIFFLLWMVRKRIKAFGVIFFLVLFFNGIERFFIEKIRVNEELTLFGIEATQAEFIAFSLILAGLIGAIWRWRKNQVA
jgi:phosphatidylglycerol---prolipoprotein diacylglyceryl transferase